MFVVIWSWWLITEKMEERKKVLCCFAFEVHMENIAWFFFLSCDIRWELWASVFWLLFLHIFFVIWICCLVAEKMEEKGSFVWFFIQASLRKHCLPFIFYLRMVRAISFYVFVVLHIFFLVILSSWESGRKEKCLFCFVLTFT